MTDTKLEESRIADALEEIAQTEFAEYLSAYREQKEELTAKCRKLLQINIQNGISIDEREIAGIVLERWHKSTVIGGAYARYLKIMHELGVKAVPSQGFCIPRLAVGAIKYTEEDGTPFSNFTLIEKRGFKIGSTVRTEYEEELYEVIAYTTQCHLVIKNISTGKTKHVRPFSYCLAKKTS